MHGNCTAYITGGRVFDVCKGIQTSPGLFSPDELSRFNSATNGRYEAIEILSHQADCGHIYRIEYNRNTPMPCS